MELISLFCIKLHCLHVEPLHVLCQANVWEKRPPNLTTIITRSHKHSLFYIAVLSGAREFRKQTWMCNKNVPTLGRQSNFYILKAPMNYIHSNQVWPHKITLCHLQTHHKKIYIKNRHHDVHKKLKWKNVMLSLILTGPKATLTWDRAPLNDRVARGSQPASYLIKLGST